MGQKVLSRYRAKFKRHLSEVLGIQNIKTERSHCVGDGKRSSCKRMVAKLSSLKIKGRTFTEAEKRKTLKILQKPRWKYGYRIRKR